MIHVPASRPFVIAIAAFTIVVIANVFIARSCAQTSTPQTGLDEAVKADVPGREKVPQAPAVVEVQPVARDEEISARLERILNATGWFQSPEVRVDEGVVFITGRTEHDHHKTWAGELAGNTRDVVAVVNKIDVTQPSLWDFQPAWKGVQELGRNAIFWVPFAALAVAILVVAVVVAVLVTRGLHMILSNRIRVPLLQKVISRSAGLLVVLIGLYFVLRICGLTRLALTLVGGTGLAGLVLGIAFRDITENFLASILLSVQAPFRTGDLIELSGVMGIVQQLNVRTTVLMSLSGHHIQLPNSVIYKSTIRNYSSNPNRREDFVVGIGYDVPIARAQEVALNVLSEHPAILKSPEPWVLVDNLGPSTVNLRIYFWLDGSEFSWLKVRSSVIRLVKRAFQEEKITMPDEVREVIFPKGVPVQMLQESHIGLETDAHLSEQSKPSDEQVSIEAEGGLGTEARQIKAQANNARMPDEGENLLQPSE